MFFCGVEQRINLMWLSDERLTSTQVPQVEFKVTLVLEWPRSLQYNVVNKLKISVCRTKKVVCVGVKLWLL